MVIIMEDLKKYIIKTIGTEIDIESVRDSKLNKLPFFILHSYNYYYAELFGQRLLLVELKDDNNFKIRQVDIHFRLIQEVFQEKLLLLIQNLDALGRKRLIEKGISFIVPGKQLFIPSMMIDLQESFSKPIVKSEKLLPSAQLILLYKILKRDENIERYNLKEISGKLKYTQMAITKAVNNLTLLGLCTTTGSKEKYLKFEYEIPELWNKAFPFMITPVLKQLYIDDLPGISQIYKSNETALASYSDMAESRQEFYAVDRSLFYDMRKKGMLTNLNETEGHYCLEVWKYNPELLANNNNVDPLSLYLSLKENPDERIEMALEQIIEKYIW